MVGASVSFAGGGSRNVQRRRTTSWWGAILQMRKLAIRVQLKLRECFSGFFYRFCRAFVVLFVLRWVVRDWLVSLFVDLRVFDDFFLRSKRRCWFRRRLIFARRGRVKLLLFAEFELLFELWLLFFWSVGDRSGTGIHAKIKNVFSVGAFFDLAF